MKNFGILFAILLLKAFLAHHIAHSLINMNKKDSDKSHNESDCKENNNNINDIELELDPFYVEMQRLLKTKNIENNKLKLCT